MELSVKNLVTILGITSLFGTLGYGATPPDSELLKATVEALPSCQNFVRYDDQYVYAGFGYTESHGAQSNLYIAKIGQAKTNAIQEWLLPDTSLDVIRLGNSLYVLDPNSLEEWDFAKKTLIAKYPTYNLGRAFGQFENPTAMVAYDGKILISHGSLGVSVFDTKSKQIVFQTKLVQSQLPLVSMATGITVQGNRAYILMDNVTLVNQGKPPFRGLVVLNLNTFQDTLKIEAELDGMDPGADAITSDSQKLIVSFMGNPIWKYGIGDLNLSASLVPDPERRVYEFPILGNPTGKASMDAKYYYTCYEELSAGGTSSRRIPVALDRAALQLN